MCVTLVIYQESLQDARSTKYKKIKKKHCNIYLEHYLIY